MDGYWQSYQRAHDRSNGEYAKWERYCRQQREILRALEDLTSRGRRMYELDDRKDQVMTALKLALANLAMWARDNYFPREYARATWRRLTPFFQLPARVARRPDTIGVELTAFNDRRLGRDLVAVCDRISEIPPRLPGGHRLVLTVKGAARCAAVEREPSVACQPIRVPTWVHCSYRRTGTDAARDTPAASPQQPAFRRVPFAPDAGGGRGRTRPGIRKRTAPSVTGSPGRSSGLPSLPG